MPKLVLRGGTALSVAARLTRHAAGTFGQRGAADRIIRRRSTRQRTYPFLVNRRLWGSWSFPCLQSKAQRDRRGGSSCSYSQCSLPRRHSMWRPVPHERARSTQTHVFSSTSLRWIRVLSQLSRRRESPSRGATRARRATLVPASGPAGPKTVGGIGSVDRFLDPGTRSVFFSWADFGLSTSPCAANPNALFRGGVHIETFAASRRGTFANCPFVTSDPVDPVRLLDTRSGNGLTGTFKANTVRTWQVAGRGGVPADALAVTGNLTMHQAHEGRLRLDRPERRQSWA